MKLTAKGRYAVTAMLDLALHEASGPVSGADMADRHGIPQPYLEQILRALRSSGLINSQRGPGGGYVLNKDAEQIGILEIIESADEEVDLTRCGGSMNCQDELPCLTHDLWTGLNQLIIAYLSDITLANLRDQRFVRETARQHQENTLWPLQTLKENALTHP